MPISKAKENLIKRIDELDAELQILEKQLKEHTQIKEMLEILKDHDITIEIGNPEHDTYCDIDFHYKGERIFRGTITILSSKNPENSL